MCVHVHMSTGTHVNMGTATHIYKSYLVLHCVCISCIPNHMDSKLREEKNPHFVSKKKYILDTTLIKSSQHAYFKFHGDRNSACCVCHCIFSAYQSIWHSRTVNKYFLNNLLEKGMQAVIKPHFIVSHTVSKRHSGGLNALCFHSLFYVCSAIFLSTMTLEGEKKNNAVLG